MPTEGEPAEPRATAGAARGADRPALRGARGGRLFPPARPHAGDPQHDPHHPHQGRLVAPRGPGAARHRPRAWPSRRGVAKRSRVGLTFRPDSLAMQAASQSEISEIMKKLRSCQLPLLLVDRCDARRPAPIAVRPDRSLRSRTRRSAGQHRPRHRLARSRRTPRLHDAGAQWPTQRAPRRSAERRARSQTRREQHPSQARRRSMRPGRQRPSSRRPLVSVDFARPQPPCARLRNWPRTPVKRRPRRTRHGPAVRSRESDDTQIGVSDHVEAHQRQVQARPPDGRERLRTPQEPGQPPRIWPRPARPAPQGQDVRLRHPAARQAEAQGLLWRRHREAVQARLYRGRAR